MTRNGGQASTKKSKTRDQALAKLKMWRDQKKEVSVLFFGKGAGESIVFTNVKGVLVAVGEKFLRCQGDGGSTVSVFSDAEFFDGPVTLIDVTDNAKIEIDAVQINLTNGDRFMVSIEPAPIQALTGGLDLPEDGNEEHG